MAVTKCNICNNLLHLMTLVTSVTSGKSEINSKQKWKDTDINWRNTGRRQTDTNAPIAIVAKHHLLDT